MVRHSGMPLNFKPVKGLLPAASDSPVRNSTDVDDRGGAKTPSVGAEALRRMPSADVSLELSSASLPESLQVEAPSVAEHGDAAPLSSSTAGQSSGQETMRDSMQTSDDATDSLEAGGAAAPAAAFSLGATGVAGSSVCSSYSSVATAVPGPGSASAVDAEVESKQQHSSASPSDAGTAAPIVSGDGDDDAAAVSTSVFTLEHWQGPPRVDVPCNAPPAATSTAHAPAEDRETAALSGDVPLFGSVADASSGSVADVRTPGTSFTAPTPGTATAHAAGLPVAEVQERPVTAAPEAAVPPAADGGAAANTWHSFDTDPVPEWQRPFPGTSPTGKRLRLNTATPTDPVHLLPTQGHVKSKPTSEADISHRGLGGQSAPNAAAPRSNTGAAHANQGRRVPHTPPSQVAAGRREPTQPPSPPIDGEAHASGVGPHNGRSPSSLEPSAAASAASPPPTDPPSNLAVPEVPPATSVQQPSAVAGNPQQLTTDWPDWPQLDFGPIVTDSSNTAAAIGTSAAAPTTESVPPPVANQPKVPAMALPRPSFESEHQPPTAASSQRSLHNWRAAALGDGLALQQEMASKLHMGADNLRRSATADSISLPPTMRDAQPRKQLQTIKQGSLHRPAAPPVKSRPKGAKPPAAKRGPAGTRPSAQFPPPRRPAAARPPPSASPSVSPPKVSSYIQWRREALPDDGSRTRSPSPIKSPQRRADGE